MCITGFWYGPIVQQTRGFLYRYCPNGLTNGLLSATSRWEWRYRKLHLWGIVRVFMCICIRVSMISASSTCMLALGLNQQKILKSIHNQITTIKSYMHVLNTGLCFCRICAQQMMTTLWHRMTPCWCLLMRVRGLNLDLSALCSCPSVMEIRTSSICRTGDLSSEDWLICLLEEKKSDMCSDHYIGVCI